MRIEIDFDPDYRNQLIDEVNSAPDLFLAYDKLREVLRYDNHIISSGTGEPDA